jgi:hypothetical protein
MQIFPANRIPEPSLLKARSCRSHVRLGTADRKIPGRTPNRIVSAMYRHPDDELIISRRAAKDPSIAALMPIMALVLIAFLVIGIALPVLPLHVHQDLGFGAFIVGLVTGSQFGASLLSRISVGHYADTRGPKRAVVIGLLTAIAAGLFYIVSLFRRCTDGLGDDPVTRTRVPWQPCRPLPSSSSGAGSRPNCLSSLIRICSDTLAAMPWLIEEPIPGRCKPFWAIATFNRRCVDRPFPRRLSSH